MVTKDHHKPDLGEILPTTGEAGLPGEGKPRLRLRVVLDQNGKASQDRGNKVL